MRRHELSFANFVLRFGVDKVMMDLAEEIVIPAFLNRAYVREYGDTTFRFFNVSLNRLATEDGIPVLALSGHFIKDTILRRQQIFRPSIGLVDDEDAIESAPSAYFILILNTHRLLYFAETVAAPSLESFSATAERFIRDEWHAYIRRERARRNVTRRSVERLTIKQLMVEIPTPVLTVLKVSGEDAISESLDRFKKITSVKLTLIHPNDEMQASAAMDAVEQLLRPAGPRNLNINATNSQGLERDETKQVVLDVTGGTNTEVLVQGLDSRDNPLKADNEEFALSVTIEDPPRDDEDLRSSLWAKYKALAHSGHIQRLITPSNLVEKLRRIADRDAD